MTDEEQSVAALATPVGFAEIVLGLYLYDWQADVITRLESATGAGAVTTRISVPAPNGSGKSSGIVAAAGVRIPVLVEIDVGGARCGVQAGPPAVALAEVIAASKHLSFGGIQAYHGSAQHIREPERRAAAIAVMRPN